MTKTYLLCLEWSREQLSEMLGKGGCIGATADQTHALSHSIMGQKLGLEEAQRVEHQLKVHEMLEVKDGA